MSKLKCPVCNYELNKEDRTYKCDNNHSYDIAKQGYVNLLQSNQQKTHGDSKEMQLARKNILYGNYYELISNELICIVGSLNSNSVLDVGSGVGYYSDKLQKSLPRIDFYGIDISKIGVKESAKMNKYIKYVVGSNNSLPFINESFDLLLSVFSPIYLEEALRVTKNNGYIITVSPNENHLRELKEIVYDEIFDRNYEENELSNNNLKHIKKFSKVQKVMIKDDDLFNLFMMTPHYWKTSQNQKDKLKNHSSLDVTIDVVFNVYQVNK